MKLGSTSGGTIEGHLQRNNLEVMSSLPEDDDLDISSDKNNEIRISISCNRTPLQTKSTWLSFMRGIFNWRRDTRNIGYYSPPMEHPIGKISIRLNADDVKLHRYQQTMSTSTINNTKDDDEYDSISNSSLKDASTAALEDELSTYMEELRLRELR